MPWRLMRRSCGRSSSIATGSGSAPMAPASRAPPGRATAGWRGKCRSFKLPSWSLEAACGEAWKDDIAMDPCYQFSPQIAASCCLGDPLAPCHWPAAAQQGCVPAALRLRQAAWWWLVVLTFPRKWPWPVARPLASLVFCPDNPWWRPALLCNGQGPVPAWLRLLRQYWQWAVEAVCLRPPRHFPVSKSYPWEHSSGSLGLRSKSPAVRPEFVSPIQGTPLRSVAMPATRCTRRLWSGWTSRPRACGTAGTLGPSYRRPEQVALLALVPMAAFGSWVVAVTSPPP
mmetsp:Transcript_63522/g.128930  ORF Transcript_63522/g.128930 Transcript_63522/m.128930 type:complete len:285 (+) Transcript_63522:72-926(+)